MKTLAVFGTINLQLCPSWNPWLHASQCFVFLDIDILLSISGCFLAFNRKEWRSERIRIVETCHYLWCPTSCVERKWIQTQAISLLVSFHLWSTDIEERLCTCTQNNSPERIVYRQVETKIHRPATIVQLYRHIHSFDKRARLIFE